MELAQWRTTTHLGSAQPLHRTLPPLTGSHVVTPDEKKTALVFDVSTGEHVVAFQHDTTILGIRDNKVYLWEAPAFVEELHRKSRTSSFSSFLDRPAIPLAGPSRNNGRFWIVSPMCADQQASPQPKWAFKKLKDKFASLFTCRPASAKQTIPWEEQWKP
ncbi:hypothetical protein PAXINDRAFT_21030 [Paxillus involutus ATCC 200175]|uniref:Uncharacterized protein n=1 Tax=Paxillus involutus ATCC 200175 TaxID=664439 RepID=A0A0C9T2L3_PAXIN|nr:hypothetical protein PAXINDRAFT_21030 [Paxillus involutus ATCC 200175]